MEDKRMPGGSAGGMGMGDMEMDADEMNAGAPGQSGEMPTGGMGEGDEAPPEMPGGAVEGGQASTGPGPERVLVELYVSQDAMTEAVGGARALPGLTLDETFEPIPMKPAAGEAAEGVAAAVEETLIVCGSVDPARRAELEADPKVKRVWSDGRIAPFEKRDAEIGEFALDAPPVADSRGFAVREGMAACPIGTCDCGPGTPKGNMAAVRGYLGVDDIWSAGYQGDGIVVGVVDGGIRASGRPIKPGESGPKLNRVIGGWPAASWGTTAAAWNDHGMMCGTDVLGMAPKAKLYDLRISDGDALSSALSAFQWAINRHRQDGTPHVMTNSWGMFQQSWAPDYTTNPNHPFTRKVLEAIDEGIIVLFAAGNCGATCPDGRCDGDTGPGKSIWGANGHERVITVGAVNKNEQFVGYSSQGPAALSPNKPDFCSITHFTGYFNSDSGTSAATPVAAGVVALLKQRKPALTQTHARALLRSTAKDIGPAGFDQNSGAGILRAKTAYDQLKPASWYGWEDLGGFCTDGVGVSSWGESRLDCFVVSKNRALYHKWYSGGWSGWENLGGQIYSNPAAVSWNSNRIDVFAIGGNRAMWHRWWDGVSWKGWENLGGFVTDGVGVSSWGPGRLDCFVVGKNRALYHKWYSGGWSGWENLGGQIYSNPAAVSWGPNRIDVFAIGGDRSMWHRWWDGASWHGWEDLGGVVTDGIGVSSWGPGRLDCFAVGKDRALWHRWYDGGWSGWEKLGGQIYSNPAAVSWSQNRIDVFALGGDRSMWHRWYV